MSATVEKLIVTKAAAKTMGKLSFVSYVWKCVLGADAAYFICLISAFALERTANVTQLHRTLFEMLPGFTWLTRASVMLGAIYVFIFAVIFGTYMVWMHNSSIND